MMRVRLEIERVAAVDSVGYRRSGQNPNLEVVVTRAYSATVRVFSCWLVVNSAWLLLLLGTEKK